MATRADIECMPLLRRLSVVSSLVLLVVLSITAPIGADTPQSPQFVSSTSRQPAFSPHQANGNDLGDLRIPAIGLDENVRAGVDLSVIDRGVSHWVGTAAPGEAGNVVLAGHRTTHTAPFYNLDKLDIGDQIFMTDPSGFDVLYRVNEVLIVDPTDIWITFETGESIVTLFACHPKGSVAQRIVIRGELVANRRIG